MAQTELFDLTPSRKEPKFFRLSLDQNTLVCKQDELLREVAAWLRAIGMTVTWEHDGLIGTIRDLRIGVYIRKNKSVPGYPDYSPRWFKTWTVHLNVSEYCRPSLADMRTVRELAADPVKWHEKAEFRARARAHFRLTGQKLKPSKARVK